MSLQIALSLLDPFARVHPVESLLDFLVPIAESNDGPLENANDIQCNALTYPEAGKTPT